MNEYRNVIDVYIGVVDKLIDIKNMYYYTQDQTKINFKAPAFRLYVEKLGGGENYRFYLKKFRTLGLIICKSEKLTNVQWINGKAERVITVDYTRYKKLKDMIEDGTYFIFLERFLNVADKVQEMNKKTDKQVCLFSKKETLLNVKSEDYRKLLKKESGTMEDYSKSLEVFRAFEWIICPIDRFTNTQDVKGKTTRVFSIDYKKYCLMKELLGTEI